MTQNFEYLIVFTSTLGVLPKQNDRYRVQPWKVNEIKSCKKVLVLSNICRHFEKKLEKYSEKIHKHFENLWENF